VEQNQIKLGDKFPTVELGESNDSYELKLIKTDDIFLGKKVAIFGVPGAFTPGCSKVHLPGYVNHYQELKDKGIDEIVCVSVNDPFVMHGWGVANNCIGKIRMFGDTHGELAAKLGLVLDVKARLGSLRIQRFSALVDNGVVTLLNIEQPGEMKCSIADSLLEQLL